MRTQILPKGIPLHEDISIANLNIFNIFRLIQKDQFSGYFRLYAEKVNGVIFYHKGQSIYTYFEDDNKKKVFRGDDAIPLVRSLYKSQNGNLSLYCFNEDSIVMLTSILTDHAIYKNLDTGFVSLNKMLSHLESRHFTGLMELKVNDLKSLCGLLFQNGSIVDGFRFNQEDNVVWGPENGAQVLENAFTRGAIFNVYEGIKEKKNKNKLPDIKKKDVEVLLNICLEVIKNEIRQNTKHLEIDQFFADACIDVTDRFPFLNPFSKKVLCYKSQIKIFVESDMKVMLNGINEVFISFFEGKLFDSPTLLPRIQNNLKKAISKPKNRRFAKMANRYLPALFNSYIHLI